MVYAFDNCELDTQRIILRRAGQTMTPTAEGVPGSPAPADPS